MSEGALFILSAPSGAGKTSLVRALLERDPNLALSISCTTRAARAGERDGVHYHFLEPAVFNAALADGAFLESAEVFGNHYGTREADVREPIAAGHDLILEIDWQGARQVRARFARTVSIFVLPPSITELERRLRERATDSDAVIAKRMRQAHGELAHCAEYDYLVVNEDFDLALDSLRAIITAQRLTEARQRPRLDALLCPGGTTETEPST